ncbi:hypothetical protein [Hyphococcus sp.]|jgi:hypothetical protein|uniref:hypothetical protein n=1 Tax=Hyphococcus sp. TaxID=2038636 RepID=UPI0035C72577
MDARSLFGGLENAHAIFERRIEMMEGGMMMGAGGAIVMLLIAVFLLLGIAAFVKYLFFHEK